jgi:uncharacterized protein
VTNVATKQTTTDRPTRRTSARTTVSPNGAHPAVPAPLRLTRDEARLIAVAAQRLDRRPPANKPRTKAMVEETIRAIGCVQLDTISVITRTHETVIWSRLGPYDPSHVAALHYPDGVLMEQWAHAAALVPIEFFPYLRRSMAFFKTRYEKWFGENEALLDRVRGAIRERGPLQARFFERPPGPKPPEWTWYGGKPEREALDALWTIGELMVLKRDGFQRTYELTERLLPEAHEGPLPPLEEQHRWFVERALDCLGIATPRWIADYFRTGGMPHVRMPYARAELTAMAAEGKAFPVEVDGWSEPTWLSPTALATLDEIRAGRRRPTLTTLLTPFDNLIWHRGRTADLFGFDYKIEVYTPAPKRRYGYYNMPILHQGKLIGRLDPSYDRRAKVLTVKALHLEPGVKPTDRIAAATAFALRDLLTFLGGQDIGVLRSDPPEFGEMVQRAVQG